MSEAASKPFVLGCTFAVLTVAIVLHFSPGGPTSSTTYPGGGTQAAAPPRADSHSPFTITGQATEAISPGVRAPIDVSLTNSHTKALSVTDLRVSVREVHAPNADAAHPCAVSDFTVDQGSNGLPITVAAGSTNTLSRLGLARATWPAVGMLNRSTNQDGCKGASLTLAYTASGTTEG